jgi:hypothetical protein
MEPITDREIMVKLDANVSQLKDSIERFANALEKLEETKIKDHEDRLMKMEKWVSEWSGAYKVIALTALAIGIFNAVKPYLK